MNRRTIPKGNALTIIAACMPCRPPVPNKIAEIAAKMIPKINVTKKGGFKFPFVVCIPRTKVAESAEVTKNVKIRTTEMVDATP